MDDSNRETAIKLRNAFPKGILICKDPNRNRSITVTGIPSFLRDWLIAKFTKDNGDVSLEDVDRYAQENIPKVDQWQSILQRAIDGEEVTFLAKVSVEMDVASGSALFKLPDFSFPKKRGDAIIDPAIVRQHRDWLLGEPETWGAVSLRWFPGSKPGESTAPWPRGARLEDGKVVMLKFRPFKPYKVDLKFYKEARKQFTVEEWIDILLSAADFNPSGFASIEAKLMLLLRLLPFVEPNLHLIELGPPGTAKSYCYSQLSKYGWLVSGGSVTRAKMFYDMSRRILGLVCHNDYVSLDEISRTNFSDVEEFSGTLMGYLEGGSVRVGNFAAQGQAGIVLLGNVDGNRSDSAKNLLQGLPAPFSTVPALIDRFQGFIEGWQIPQMSEGMRAEGWSLNTEYFSEILHSLREETVYANLVDSILRYPSDAYARDVQSIKKLAAAFCKLLFPNATRVEDLSAQDFIQFCLMPALRMRQIIRKQLNIMDPNQYRNEALPNVWVEINGASYTI